MAKVAFPRDPVKPMMAGRSAENHRKRRQNGCKFRFERKRRIDDDQAAAGAAAAGAFVAAFFAGARFVALAVLDGFAALL